MVKDILSIGLSKSNKKGVCITNELISKLCSCWLGRKGGAQLVQ
jgi:hypothetical protein